MDDTATTTSFLSGLHQRQKTGDFCDVTLVPGGSGGSIRAHKIVLIARSSFFKATLLSSAAAANDDEVDLSNIDGNTLSALVGYLYTGKVVSEEEVHVCKLLIAADFLDLPDLFEKCTAAVLNNPKDTGHALCLMRFPGGGEDWQRRVNAFAEEHFEEIIESSQFLELETNEVTELLSKDTVVVASEDQILEAALKWLEFNNSRDNISMKSLLMEQVRICYLSKKGMETYFDTQPQKLLPPPPRRYKCPPELCTALWWETMEHLGRNLAYQLPRLASAVPAVALCDYEQLGGPRLNTPYSSLPTAFRAGQRVEVFCRGGGDDYWWSGVTTGSKRGKNLYTVVFPSFAVRILKEEELNNWPMVHPGYLYKSDEYRWRARYREEEWRGLT